jgi:hypothetical protein
MSIILDLKFKYIKRRFVFFVILSLIYTGLNAQSNLNYDSSEVKLRIPEKQIIEEYISSIDFQYQNDVENPITFWDKVKLWLINKFFKLFSNEGAAPLVRYILIGLLFVLVLVKLLNTNLKSLFFKSKQHIKIDYSVSEDDISNINIEEVILNAINSKSYRIATRYLFLKTLKILTEKEIIEWKINKTNNDYFIEMNDKKYIKEFKSLSSSFEYIWYGNFDISEKNFNQLNLRFNNYFKIIL